MPITGYPGWVDALRQGEKLSGTIDAYGNVPMIYRAVNLRCDAISSVPFHIYRNDTQVDWPWSQDLAQLIKETERDLLLTGASFWLKIQKGQVIRGFQKLNAQTVQVKYDGASPEPDNPYAGVTFQQMLRGKTFGPWTTDQMVYFREPSMTDDIGPGVPAVRVALQNAQLDYYLERFITHFFEGGAQPITMVNLPAEVDEAEFQRFRTDWQARFSGVVNAFRTAFIRSPDIKVTKLTPDLNTMLLDELQERVITKISAVLGVPRTMVEASAANYATADSDRQSFWRETIVPRLSLYTHVINDQLLAPLNYRIAFHPDELDVLQADEAARADSVLKLVQAGVPIRGAMEILGYDNVDRALGAEPSAPTLAPPAPPQPKDDTEPTPDAVAPSAQMPVQSMASLTARRSEWALLAKKIERRIKAGKAPFVAFDSDVITSDEVKAVNMELWQGMTVQEAQHVIDAHKAVDDLTPDERRIVDKVMPELTKRGTQWARQIVQGKTTDPSLRDVLQPILSTELSTVIANRIDKLGADYGVPYENPNVELDYLSDYMPRLNKEINETTAKVLDKVIAQYRITPGMTIKDVESALTPAVGRSRASAIAITEITRAASHATISYQTYLAQNGLNYERVWNSENDPVVCPICEPLNGKGEDDWIAEYPSGPPAHTRCRCDTTLRRVK